MGVGATVLAPLHANKATIEPIIAAITGIIELIAGLIFAHTFARDVNCGIATNYTDANFSSLVSCIIQIKLLTFVPIGGLIAGICSN